MMSGRSIEEFDDANAPHVAVLSETAATALFAATNPHGRRIRRDIRYQTVKGGTEPEIQIIGVVNDVQFFAFGGKPGPVIYLPLLQSRDSYEAHTMVIRTHGGSAGMIPEMRKAIQMVDQGAALGEIETLDGYVDKQYAVPRFNLSIIGIFGAVAFGLATIGIYGTIAYAVSQRTHEIGIRMALGAQRGHVLRLVIRQGLWIVLIGEVIGLVGSVWLMRLAAHFMYGLRETDGLTFIVVSVSWAFIAIVASYIPARRATLIDPLLALRCE
jgi:putative ABC transport system permease protein